MDNIDFSRLALDLDQAMSAWSRKKDRAGAVTTLNRVATELGIVGGAFGVADVEKDEFRLDRALSQEQGQGVSRLPLLFPYSLPVSSSAIRRLTDFGIEKEYPEWMHRVFGLHRERQRLENAKGIVAAPEFYAQLGSRVAQPDEATSLDTQDFVLVPWGQICGVLQCWLDIWVTASNSKKGLATTCENTHFPLETSVERTLYDVVATAREQTVSVSYAYSRMKELPEELFFFCHFEPESNDASTVRLLWDIAKRISIEEIRQAICDSKTEIPYRESPTGSSLLLAQLESLHRNALFPILPYLFLAALDSRPKHHCVLPLLHSPEFPLRISAPAVGPYQETRLHSCVLVFLGTIGSSDTAPPSREHLAATSILMKRAAEPIAEGVFYGGIYRRKLEAESAENTFRAFFQSITHELSGLQARLTDSWLIPLTECFAVSSQESGQRTGAFGSRNV